MRFFSKKEELSNSLILSTDTDENIREAFREDILGRLERRITELEKESSNFFCFSKYRKSRKIEVLRSISDAIKRDFIFTSFTPRHTLPSRTEYIIDDFRSHHSNLDAGNVFSRTKDMLDDIISDARTLERTVIPMKEERVQIFAELDAQFN